MMLKAVGSYGTDTKPEILELFCFMGQNGNKWLTATLLLMHLLCKQVLQNPQTR